MAIFMYVVAVLFGLVGALQWMISQTAMHQVVAAVLLLIAAVFWGSACNVVAIQELRKAIAAPPAAPPAGAVPAAAATTAKLKAHPTDRVFWIAAATIAGIVVVLVIVAELVSQ